MKIKKNITTYILSLYFFYIIITLEIFYLDYHIILKKIYDEKKINLYFWS